MFDPADPLLDFGVIDTKFVRKRERGPYTNEPNLYVFYSSSSIYSGSISRNFHLTGFGWIWQYDWCISSD